MINKIYKNSKELLEMVNRLIEMDNTLTISQAIKLVEISVNLTVEEDKRYR